VPCRADSGLHALDWRVHDVVLAPVTSLEDVPEGILVGERGVGGRRDRS
jgi:hypothetical protein